MSLKHKRIVSVACVYVWRKWKSNILQRLERDWVLVKYGQELDKRNVRQWNREDRNKKEATKSSKHSGKNWISITESKNNFILNLKFGYQNCKRKHWKMCKRTVVKVKIVKEAKFVTISHHKLTSVIMQINVVTRFLRNMKFDKVRWDC